MHHVFIARNLIKKINVKWFLTERNKNVIFFYYPNHSHGFFFTTQYLLNQQGFSRNESRPSRSLAIAVCRFIFVNVNKVPVHNKNNKKVRHAHNSWKLRDIKKEYSDLVCKSNNALVKFLT